MLNRARGTRPLAGAHLAQAVLLLAQPPTILHGIAGNQDVPPAWTVRVLGVRTLIQGAAEASRPSRGVLRLGVAVDLAHAASMLVAAFVWPRYRRAALASAAGASASAIAGTLLLRQRP